MAHKYREGHSQPRQVITIMRYGYSLSSKNGRAAARHGRLVANKYSVRVTTASNYWTVTEYNSNNAWNLNFSNGNFNNNNKNNSLIVRAVAALTDDEILSIVEAYDDCCRHKKTAMQCTLFRLVYEYELLILYAEMKTGEYHPTTSIVFIVTRPRLREVYAANFRDRIVQHWIVIRVNPIIEQRFLDTGDASYNCRKGYGMHRAVKRLQAYMIEMEHLSVDDLCVMKLDIRSFFMSIDTCLLETMLIDLIEGCYQGEDKAMLLRLCRVVVSHRPDTDCIYKGDPALRVLMPSHKMMANIPKGRSMPIGNITSQEFANFYMTPFDLLALLYCRMFCCRYIRFVDDFAMVGSRRAMLAFRQLAQRFLSEELHLTLHPDKMYLQPISHGVTFVGSIVNTHRIRLIRRTIGTLHDSVASLDEICLMRHAQKWNDTAEHRAWEEHLVCSVNSLLGFTRHTDDFRSVARIFSSASHLVYYYSLSPNITKIKRLKIWKQPTSCRAYTAKAQTTSISSTSAHRRARGRKATSSARKSACQSLPGTMPISSLPSCAAATGRTP